MGPAFGCFGGRYGIFGRKAVFERTGLDRAFD